MPGIIFLRNWWQSPRKLLAKVVKVAKVIKVAKLARVVKVVKVARRS